jgi:hypothetical protein
MYIAIYFYLFHPNYYYLVQIQNAKMPKTKLIVDIKMYTYVFTYNCTLTLPNLS